MLEMENLKHHVSSVFIIGYSVNGAGQLKHGTVSWKTLQKLQDRSVK